MALGKHLPLLSVFVGGCLSGAALLSLWGTASTPHGKSAERRLSTLPQERSVERDDALREPVERKVRVETRVDATPSPSDRSGDLARSLGDVLAHLEAAYQEQLTAAPAGEPEATELEASDSEALAREAPESEAKLDDAPVVPDDANEEPEPPVLVENEVVVAVNQRDAREREAIVGELVLGDQVQGSQVEGNVHVGDVHQGDVNHVQQVALLYYQPVVVAPPTAQRVPPTASRAERRPVNPFGSVTISPKHDPWKTMLAEPGNPWSTVGPLTR